MQLHCASVLPLNVLLQDLDEAELLRVHNTNAMWTSEHAIPLLPWSAVVLVSVPESHAPASLRAPGGGRLAQRLVEGQVQVGGVGRRR